METNAAQVWQCPSGLVCWEAAEEAQDFFTVDLFDLEKE